MGWDKGRYYTRSRRVSGRVVREYIGAGRFGEMAAQMDACRREQRQAEQAKEKALRAEINALDATLNDLNEVADMVAEAALLAAGYHRHKRGEWRKKRA